MRKSDAIHQLAERFHDESEANFGVQWWTYVSIVAFEFLEEIGMQPPPMEIIEDIPNSEAKLKYCDYIWEPELILPKGEMNNDLDKA